MQNYLNLSDAIPYGLILEMTSLLKLTKFCISAQRNQLFQQARIPAEPEGRNLDAEKR